MLLTATQLFDLSVDLLKAKKEPNQTGPRGGRYYLSVTGEKIYPGKSPPLVVTNAMDVPHLSSDHGDVQVEIVPGKKELPKEFQQVMRLRSPKTREDKRSARAFIQAQTSSHWPSYFCRSCKAIVLPEHNKPTVEVREIENPATGNKTRVEEVTERKTAVTLLHTQGPKAGQRESIDPPDPAAVAQKLCPECFEQHHVVVRKVVGKFAPPKPGEGSQLRKEHEKALGKTLKQALKKEPHQRTEEEKRLVREHEAKQAVSTRAAEERIKAEGVSTVERRERESNREAKNEEAALKELREKYKTHLVRAGIPTNEAETQALGLSAKDARAFEQQLLQAHATRRSEIHHRMAEEGSGKKIARVVSIGDLQSFMDRRREGVKGSETAHAAYEEGLKPAQAKQKDVIRKERLREREREQAKKTEKSLSLWVAM